MRKFLLPLAALLLLFHFAFGCGNNDDTFQKETTPIYQTQNPIIPIVTTSTTTSTAR